MESVARGDQRRLIGESMTGSNLEKKKKKNLICVDKAHVSGNRVFHFSACGTAHGYCWTR